jgi:hypothetical protein
MKQGPSIIDKMIKLSSEMSKEGGEGEVNFQNEKYNEQMDGMFFGKVPEPISQIVMP